MADTLKTNPYAQRHEPAAGVGAPIVRRRTGDLHGIQATDRGLGFLIGLCAVASVGLFITWALMLLTGTGQ